MIIDSGIVTGSLLVQGPLTVSGSLSVTDGITGSLQGTASYALSALTASYLLGQSPTASYALTASYADNFTVGGTLTAQTIVAQTITSSIEFITGSTRNGSLLSNTHQFTGSVDITGSLTVKAPLIISSSTSTSGINFGGTFWRIESTGASLTYNGGSGFIFNAGNSNPYKFNFANNTLMQLTGSTGALMLQSSGSFVDNGYRLQVQPAVSGSLWASGPSSFTGSVNITGSISMSGDLIFSPSNTYQIGSPTLYPTVITTSTSRAAIFRPLLTSGFEYRSFDNINVIGKWFNNGNLLVQSGSALTDNGYRFQINSTGAESGSLYTDGLVVHTGTLSGSFTSNNPSSSLIAISGSIIPSASISNANAMLINTVMSASANNQTLIGLNIVPRFSTTGYTGTNVYALQVTGNANFRDTIYTQQGMRSFADNTLSTSNSSYSLFFQVGSINYLKLSGSNGNVTLQNGGIYNDNGYRLQVNGSGSASGALFISGSSVFSGSVTSTTGFTGSLLGTAATASYVVTAQTASYVLNAISSSYATNALNAQTASYANNFTVAGTLSAQTIVVQTITSSVDFVTGSTRFGSTTANTHQFTGSVFVSGSLQVNGSDVILSNQTSSMSVATASYATQALSASYWSGSITNAESASYALTASYSNNATSASYAINALSASYWSGSIINAATASYVLQAVSASYWSGSIINAATASYVVTAQTASYVLQAVSASYWSGSILNSTSASYALTASYAANVPETASYALVANTASFALTASYISGSGAGVGFPFSGSAIITGSLFVSSSFISGSFKGDGSQITGLTAGGKIHTQSTAASTWTFTHNLGVQYPNVTVYNASNEIILPQTITATDSNTLVLEFGSAITGYAIAGIGGIINVQGRTTQQYFTAATTWSFAHNLGDKYVSIQAFDDAFEMMIPSTIRLVDYTSSVLLFESASSGYAVATIGGDLPAISSSYAGYTLQVASSAPYSASWVAIPNVTVTNAVTASYLNPITNSFIVLSNVSSSLNFVDDTAAASGGVPLGGLYRNGNFILIRLS
jgi:hypothetical protein